MVRKIYVERDFDLTRAAYDFMDETPYLRLYGGLGSDSQTNASGYADETMDELLVQVKTATSDENKSKAIARVQEHANKTVPYAIWGPSKVFVNWDPSIHRVHRSADNILLLNDTWINQG